MQLRAVTSLFLRLRGGRRDDGKASNAGSAFYDFCPNGYVPADHLLRRIDRLLELGSVYQEPARHYSSIGRPWIDAELMIRILIVGYCFAIRSERRLCDEAHLQQTKSTKSANPRLGSDGWLTTAEQRSADIQSILFDGLFGVKQTCILAVEMSAQRFDSDATALVFEYESSVP